MLVRRVPLATNNPSGRVETLPSSSIKENQYSHEPKPEPKLKHARDQQDKIYAYRA